MGVHRHRRCSAGITALAAHRPRQGHREHLRPRRASSGNCATTPQRTVIAQLACGRLRRDLEPALLLHPGDDRPRPHPRRQHGIQRLPDARLDPRPAPAHADPARHPGDRLAYSNGIIALAAVAGALLVAYQASVTRLIQLYILGVFTSFTLSQIGMVRHWNTELLRVLGHRSTTSDPRLACHQRARGDPHRPRPRHRPADEVHPWRLSRRHRRADPRRRHGPDLAALPDRRGRELTPTPRVAPAAQSRPRHRPRLPRCTSPRSGRSPTPGPPALHPDRAHRAGGPGGDAG